MNMTHPWKNFAMSSLVLTVVGGIVLRLAFSGWSIPFLSGFDLRQALYKISVVIAIISFFLSGYGPVSHAFSFLVLVVWIVFAIKNFKRHSPLQRHWLGCIPIGVLGSVTTLSLVIVWAALKQPDISLRFVRSFLTVLLYSVILPVALQAFGSSRRPAWLWWLGTMGLAAFVTGLPFSKYFFWGPIVLSLLLLEFVRAQNHTHRASFYFLLLSGGLFLFGTGLVQNSHFIAVAGIHFLILGPILTSFVAMKNKTQRCLYDACTLTMVSALLALDVLPAQNIVWQRVAAVCGFGILLVIVSVLAGKIFRKIHPVMI